MNMVCERKGCGGFGGMVYGVRSFGSVILDFVYMVMGLFDIWWEGGCWEWYVFYFGVQGIQLIKSRDVVVGIVMFYEVGGLIMIVNLLENFEIVEIFEVKVGGRFYFVIRQVKM